MESLYVHIPFCKRKCRYCNFASYAGSEALIPGYIKALLSELYLYRGIKFRTLFFGGGTPSVLAHEELETLLSGIHNRVSLADTPEVTLECNPESLDREKLIIMKAWGVNRLSFGLQSADDRLLKNLGRLHNYGIFLDRYDAAREMGFMNINIDLIYDIPGQSGAMWKNELTSVIKLRPQHLSLYPLTIEDGTEFKRKAVSTDEDMQADMYLTACGILSESGYSHYEISNWAYKDGDRTHICGHNLTYWKNRDYAGVGSSSVTYRDGKRRKNIDDPAKYSERILAGLEATEYEEKLDTQKRNAEELILNLRLKEGISTEAFFKNSLNKKLAGFIDTGMIKEDGSRISLTEEGWLISNRLFSEILP